MTLDEVKQIIREERQLYLAKQYHFMKSTYHKRYLIWKTLSSFRMAQYWKAELSNRSAGLPHRVFAKAAYRFWLRRKNIYGEKSGVEIANHCTLGRRLNIWHGGVILSGHLGDDCVIHGNNVIGNKGTGILDIPQLGNGVDVGVGAVIIGGVTIADGCRIGANAVVNKDFAYPGSLIVGIPAYVKGN